jgi:trehalose/maltose hydrolase-like predicted phosphorylase
MTLPDILKPVEQSFKFYDEVPGTPLFSSIADSPTGKHQLAATNVYFFPGDPPHVTHETISAREHEVHFSLNLTKGETYHFGLVGSICSTANFADPINEAERLSIFAKLEGQERLMANHRRAWAKLWESDIVIEGDLEAQRDARFALYNLYSFARAGSRCSLAPMGLSSLGYNGHIFWDCELWMYPPLLMLQPEIARTLLDYRYDHLGAARRKAMSYGFRGAMYPWESDDTGEECTPTWAITGPFEHHITACIGIACWYYYLVTQDKDWLAETGYPILEQVAEFWLSRVEPDEAGQYPTLPSLPSGGDRGGEGSGYRYEIKNVVGADEYTGVVNNNAFTNGAVITALRYAGLAARVLGLEPNPQWQRVADNIRLLKFDDGTTQEYEGYDGRTIKQADVNLLAYPLEIITDEATIRKDLDYYEPRLDEDAPAMSHSVLAVICARLGDRERAYELFKRAYQPNQKPPFGVLSETPYSDNPYFATAAGGMLQVVLAGFGGLTFTENGIEQKSPCLPKRWRSLTITGVGVKKETFTVHVFKDRKSA